LKIENSHLTVDTFFNGRILVKQHRDGYRFSIDAVLLASHVMPRPGDTVLDLGTGCGIIPLILAYRYPQISIYGIEIQQRLADIAAVNVKENRMEDRITILCKDMKHLKQNSIPEPARLVITNPPYRKADSGRINPNQERAVARHEIKAALFDVLDTARRMLRISGRFVSIYPAERMTDMLAQMRSSGIEPKYIRMIHSGPNTDAVLILVQGIRGGHPGMKIGPPLVICREDGSYTDELSELIDN
jgi:tRNA1Val (adenine37-N6)-methyltransferase